MLPPAAARVLSNIADEVALGLLTAVGAQPAVAVLRHVAEPRRSRLIEGLPTVTAVASRLLLGYPEDSIGGWADPAIVVVDLAMPAADALERVRRGDEQHVEELYAVDTEQRLVGVVDLQALLRAPPTATVSTLLRKPPGILAAVAPLASTTTHAAWEQSAVLPVAERGDRLIGVLRRSTLSQALAQGGASLPPPGADTVIGLLARGYWTAVSGLAEAGIALLPPAKPVNPEKR
jgi:magnesium transporter